MPGLDNEEFYESDSSDNEEKYSNLVNSIAQLDSSQRVKPAQRREITSEVSEFSLSHGLTSNKNLINVKELVQALGQKPNYGVISKKFKNISKIKTLRKPLEKPVEERIKRSIGFENVKNELKKWDAIVARNSLKDHIKFPLNDNSMKMQKSKEFLSQFKTATPLEEEISKILKQEENTEEKETEEDKYPLTLEEMMEKRKEMAQLRAKLSYRQSKAQRQSKIKSKKYHRLLKREKVRQQLKEFELLQKTDPEAALKKLSELDKTRAKERASLRHRNTGKWAKNLTVRAKYDVETRKVLAEQLKISRELTQKVAESDTSDDEESVNSHSGANVLPNQSVGSIPSCAGNPWMTEVSKEVQDFVNGCTKFWNEKGEEINRDESGKLDEKKPIGENDAENINAVQNEKVIRNVEESESEKMQETSEQEREKGAGPKIVQKVHSPKANLKVSPKKQKAFVTVHPASGVWIVEPITDDVDSHTSNKRKAKDIDALFEELDDKLIKKATKKVKKIKKKLQKHTDNKKKEEVKNRNSVGESDLPLKWRKVVERPDLDEGLLEGGSEEHVGTGVVNADVCESSYSSSNKAPPEIDPKKFIQIKPKRLKTHLPENITGDEEGVDDEKTQQMVMEEAFGDDDVMADFREMKKQEEKSSKVEIETSLPGWGQWAGAGIVAKRRKKRRLILNLPPRKDKNRKDVIINENENPNLKNHLVKEVPHPFKSVDAFEANIRAPVGREWVPETAHQKLVQKQVTTKLGTIIEPMSEDEIVRFKKASQSPYQGKKKKEKS